MKCPCHKKVIRRARCREPRGIVKRGRDQCSGKEGLTNTPKEHCNPKHLATRQPLHYTTINTMAAFNLTLLLSTLTLTASRSAASLSTGQHPMAHSTLATQQQPHKRQQQAAGARYYATWTEDAMCSSKLSETFESWEESFGSLEECCEVVFGWAMEDCLRE